MALLGAAPTHRAPGPGFEPALLSRWPQIPGLAPHKAGPGPKAPPPPTTCYSRAFGRPGHRCEPPRRHLERRLGPTPSPRQSFGKGSRLRGATLEPGAGAGPQGTIP